MTFSSHVFSESVSTDELEDESCVFKDENGKIGHYTALPLAIAAMKQIFQMHSNLGGLYHIVTPGYVWTNMVLTKFSDITEDPAQAPASLFQLDFQKPIVTHSGAAQEMSSLVTQFHTGAILP